MSLSVENPEQLPDKYKAAKYVYFTNIFIEVAEVAEIIPRHL